VFRGPFRGSLGGVCGCYGGAEGVRRAFRACSGVFLGGGRRGVLGVFSGCLGGVDWPCRRGDGAKEQVGHEILAGLKRRKFILKAEVESIISHTSFKRLVPGGFNLGFIGSTCTALPGVVRYASPCTLRLSTSTV